MTICCINKYYELPIRAEMGSSKCNKENLLKVTSTKYKILEEF